MQRSFSTDELVRRVRNCFLGAESGDATGMPVETETRQKIFEDTGGKGVTGYIDPIQRKIRETAVLKAGMTTDDWALIRTVSESLIEARGFDRHSMARWHVRFYDECLWGPHAGDTKVSTLAFKAHFDGDDVNGRHPETPAPDRGPKTGLGNGVAVKIAPVALWHAIRQGRFEPEPFLSDAIALGRMTHSHVDATVAAVALGSLVGQAFWEPIRTLAETDRAFGCMCDMVDSAAHRLQYVGASTFAERLARIASGSILPEKIAEETGTGCNALESVPFAIAMFLLNPNDLRKSILDAVNCGGDTDTIAAMVGAMCGVNLDLAREMPSDLIDGLRDKGRVATDLAERFVAAALS